MSENIKNTSGDAAILELCARSEFGRLLGWISRKKSWDHVNGKAPLVINLCLNKKNVVVPHPPT